MLYKPDTSAFKRRLIKDNDGKRKAFALLLPKVSKRIKIRKPVNLETFGRLKRVWLIPPNNKDICIDRKKLSEFPNWSISENNEFLICNNVQEKSWILIELAEN